MENEKLKMEPERRNAPTMPTPPMATSTTSEPPKPSETKETEKPKKAWKDMTDEERAEDARQKAERAQKRADRAKEKWQKLEAAAEEGRKAALIRILYENGIKTETKLQQGLKFLAEKKPDYFPPDADIFQKPTDQK